MQKGTKSLLYTAFISKRMINYTVDKKLEETTITIKQTEEDASVLVTNATISLCSTLDIVLVVSEEDDLLVMLTALEPFQNNILIRKLAGKLYLTKRAARHQAVMTYHRMQKWYGFQTNPED